MAKSPAHRIGQIIGYAMEQSMQPLMEAVAEEHDLYLDTIGSREARGGKKLVSWENDTGSKHNLDFVLERGGTPAKVGEPVAFIESAWRRYTKHSVNKAGEITAALLPLRQRHSRSRPFLGAVVSGVWTEGGLGHMTAQGVRVLHIPREDVIAAFAKYGIDVDYGEDTDTDYLQAQVDAWDALTEQDQRALSLSLMQTSRERYEIFRDALDRHLRRRVTRVLVLLLHGEQQTFETAAEAVKSLQAYDGKPTGSAILARIEIQVRFSNDDRIEAQFADTVEAIAWLETQV